MQRCGVLALDVTDQETVDAAAVHIFESAGRIDVVVNNAGGGTTGLLEAFTFDQVRESLETVAIGALRSDKAVLDRTPLLRGGGGAVAGSPTDARDANGSSNQPRRLDLLQPLEHGR